MAAGWLIRASTLVLLVQIPVGIIGQYPPYNQYNNQQYPPYQPGPPPQNPAVGLGYRDYGDECVPKNSNFMYGDESKQCDVGRGLFCAHFRCACFIPGTIYRNGKCRGRVARSCEGSDGTTVECVVNAECNPGTRHCQCRRGYWSNDEGTACNHGHRVKLNHSISYLFVFSIFLTYIYGQLL